MIPRFSQFPKHLAERARSVTLGGVPALLAHPDWATRSPWVLWLHGRTAFKELDPGRYLRWIRAGVGAVAIDLPGHGERTDRAMQEPARSLDVVDQALGELDGVVGALRQEYGELFDPARGGIGGMSAGGMVALRRLCDPHPFKAAAVEGTTGWLEAQYFPAEFGVEGARPWPVDHPRARVRRLEAMSRLAAWRPIPLLAVHSRGDEIVSWASQSAFLGALRGHYAARGADPAMVRELVFETTGAPREHLGFGAMSNDAKNAQTEFFAREL